MTDLLRGKLGFTGYVNSDTGIISDRAWGLEQRPSRSARRPPSTAAPTSSPDSTRTRPSRIWFAPILFRSARIDEAATTLADRTVPSRPVRESLRRRERGGERHWQRSRTGAQGLEVQKQSIVLLAEPEPAGVAASCCRCGDGATVYTIGMGKADVERYGFTVIDGNAAPGADEAQRGGQRRRHHPRAGAQREHERLSIEEIRATGANPTRLNPLTGKTWGAEDPCVLFPTVNPVCTDDGQLGQGPARGLLFGGALPWEANHLSFTTMAASQSWQITPSLASIQAVMKEVGAAKTVLAIYFRNPYVLDDESGLKEAGAILASFGVSDTALLEVISGRFKPRGKLPFALARTLQAVIDNEPDVPGYRAADTLYPFKFGLTY